MASPTIPAPPWLPAPKARRQRSPLTLEGIVTEALRIVDAEGIDAVTMRRIASALGTGPASLYSYVSGKDEVLRLAHDRVLDQIDLPDLAELSWADAIRAWAHATYDAYRRHNDIARLSFADIPTGPRTLALFEALLRALLDGGIPPQVAAWSVDRLALFVAADAYEGWVFGQRFQGHDAAAQRRAAGWFDEVHAYFCTLPRESFPTIVEHADVLFAGDGEARFGFGLEMFVAGLATTVTKRRR